MNFFGGKKDSNQFSGSYSIEELEKLISEKQNEIEELNSSLDDLNRQIAKTDEDYQEKIAALNEKQDIFYQELEKKNKKTAKELEKLEQKEEEYKAEFENQRSDIISKINALKAKKKELLDKENSMETDAFDRKRNQIEKRLKDLRKKKKDEEDQFNLQMNELKEKYDNTLAKQSKEGNDLEDKLAKIKAQGESEIADLNTALKEVEQEHNEALQQLSDLQEERIKAIRAKEEATIAERKNQLNDLNAEVKSLLSEKNELSRKLEQHISNSDRELSTTESNYEAEKERLLNENETLANDIVRKDAELNISIDKANSQYKSDSTVLNKLLALLNDERNTKFDRLQTALGGLSPELSDRYKEYLGEMDEKFASERAKREKDLEVMRYNLTQEEELLNSRNEFLNTRFRNRDEQYRASAEKSIEAIKALEEDIFAINSATAEKADALRQRIEEAKNSNAEVIRSRSQEYDLQIEDLKKEYAGKIADINSQIAEVKENIGSINKEIGAIQKNTEDYNNSFESRKLNLDDEHEKTMIEINTEKAKLNDRYKAYETRNEENKRLIERRNNEITAKIQKLIDRKKELLENEEDRDISDFEEKKTAIEVRLEELRVTKKDQGDDFNKRMNEMKQGYETLLADKNGVIESLQRQKQELIAEGEAKISGLENTLSDIKARHEEELQKMADEHSAQLNELRGFEDAKVAEITTELNRNNNEAATLENQKNKFIADFEKNRNDSEKQYEDSIRSFDVESRRLKKENADLEKEVEDKEKQLADDIDDQRRHFEKENSDLDRLTQVFFDNENEKQVELKKAVDRLNVELRNRYEAYVGDLDSKFTADKERRQKELSVLKYNLDEEEKQLKNRNDFLNSRYQKREELYKNNVAETENVIAGINDEVAELNKQLEEKVAYLNDEIAKTKQNNELAIANKGKENEKELATTRNEYTIRMNNIRNNISDIKNKIGGLNKDIQRAQKDAEIYKNDYEARKLNLEKDQEAYLKAVAEKRSELDEKLLSVKQRIEENEKKYQNNVSILEKRKADVNSVHENKMKEIINAYDAKVLEINQRHEEALEDALSVRNNKMAELEADFNKQVKTANDTFEAKKNEYEEAKMNIDGVLDKINSQTNAKINALFTERSNLLQTISNIKVEMEDKQVEFDQQIQQLEEERNNKLEEMARKQEEDLAKITEDYETIPSRQLQAIRDEYAAKQREYNENAQTIASRISQIDETEAAEINKHNQEKAEADKKLEEANNELIRAKEEAANLEAELNSQLKKKQQELESFKDDLAKEVQEIRDSNAAELEKLTAKLEEEYNEAERQYKEKLSSTENQFDERIKSYRDEMQTKHDSLDTLIKEIDARKQATEKECIARYNVAAEKTKVIQKELDELVKANEFKRSELSTSLQRKQDAINAELDSIRGSYNNILDEKKRAYQKYIDEVSEKCNGLKGEMAQLEEKKAIELSKLETYGNEKQTAMADMSRVTNDYIDSISEKVKQIAKQINELEDAHNKRIYNIKTEIASTMSDYDTLLRSKPQLIEDTHRDGEKALTDRTRLFKEKLDSLDRSHNEILNELAKKRNDILNGITDEISELEVGRENRLEQYENEIKGISKAYDLMLKDENDKQQALSAQIKKARAEQDKFMANMYNDELTASSDFESEKKRLGVIHQNSLNQSAKEFKELSDSIKEEFEQLVASRKGITREIADLHERYKLIDDEIAQDELKLRYECNSKLLEARKMFEEEQSKKKEKLNLLDMLNDNARNLFKS